MRRDAYLAALEQERVLPLTRWPWEVEADPDDPDLANPKDPYSDDRERVRRLLQACCRRTPSLSQLVTALGSAVFFGRSGAQLAWTQDTVAGEPRWVVRAWEPVHGDAIQYDWDGTPGITIRPGDTGAFPPEDVKLWDGGTLLAMLRRPHLRQRFILHAHKREAADYWQPEMAGRSHGVGLRDYVYWAWWLRDEMLSWLTDYMEKVGSMGLLLFYYEDGNPAAEAAAKQAAADARGKSALAVPVPRGRDKDAAKVEVIAAQTAGAQFLVDMVDRYFERHIERLYVGQSLSAGTEGGGLGGSGVAALHADTKFNLLAWDADNLAETLTRDLVGVLQRLNFRDTRWRYRWAFRLPDPDAKDKLDALVKAANLPGAKLTFKADDVRALVGLTKPGPGDEIVGGGEPQRALAGDPVGYAQDSPHAPRGGIDLKGKHFLGGQFVPKGGGSAVSVATPYEPKDDIPVYRYHPLPNGMAQIVMPDGSSRTMRLAQFEGTLKEIHGDKYRLEKIERHDVEGLRKQFPQATPYLPKTPKEEGQEMREAAAKRPDGWKLLSATVFAGPLATKQVSPDERVIIYRDPDGGTRTVNIVRVNYHEQLAQTQKMYTDLSNSRLAQDPVESERLQREAAAKAARAAKDLADNPPKYLYIPIVINTGRPGNPVESAIRFYETSHAEGWAAWALKQKWVPVWGTATHVDQAIQLWDKDRFEAHRELMLAAHSFAEDVLFVYGAKGLTAVARGRVVGSMPLKSVSSWEEAASLAHGSAEARILSGLDLMAGNGAVGRTVLDKRAIGHLARGIEADSGNRVTVKLASEAPAEVQPYLTGKKPAFHVPRDGGKPVIYMHEGNSLSAFWHEYFHYRNWYDRAVSGIVREPYLVRSPILRETDVLERFLDHNTIWRLMTKNERRVQIESLRNHLNDAAALGELTEAEREAAAAMMRRAELRMNDVSITGE
ncbi:phage portal protein family protein [Fimbriiglobus ruber]|uniref:Phage protein n=1 Tax=Fimbriiglobus ruber TaxID=1908690 RepID=A0A225DW10_9BACT|nr:DUF935 family protein [Fimbriiglobus ruber]OWK45730.1 hypothetical protein FRUB_02061 [Fimbriiglobus ruber]